MYACGSGAQRGQVSDLTGSCELPDMDIRNQILQVCHRLSGISFLTYKLLH